MSKKSSTFALEMKKKSYIQPITEIINLQTAEVWLFESPTNITPVGAPPRQEAPVF